MLMFSGAIIAGLFGFGIYVQLIEGKSFGNNPMSDSGLIISFILTLALFLLVLLLFRLAVLKITITEQGISYKFFPFHFKFHEIKYNLIDSYELITYNPIRDYGGWGIRFGKNGKAYNVSGNQGLLLKLKTGKSVLFGTQRVDALKHAMEKMMEKS